MPVRLRDIVETAQTISADMPARSAFNLFSSHPTLSAIAVVEDGAALGLLTRVQLAEMLASPNGHTILASRNVSNIMDTQFATAELKVPVAAIAKLAAEKNSKVLTDGIIVLDDGQYVGLASPKSILKTVAEENAARARAMHKSKKRMEAVEIEAEAQSQKRTELLATLSHEIRTPLTGVLGVADLLVDSPLPKQSRHYAKTIASSGRLLDRLLTDMLDLSRMEAGKLSLNPEPLNLRDFATEARDLWSAKTVDRNVALKISIARKSAKRVVADGIRLKQILFNLMSNALKFTEKGHVDVELSAMKADDGQLFLSMTVADTGCGIADEHKERLFKQFEQVGDNTAALYGGSGLGLSIAKGLTEMMGGTLTLSDNPAGGSIFEVKVGVDAVGPKLAVNNPDRPRRGRLELGEILIIEDHRVSQMVMERALTAAGWKVDSVFTGEQGLRRAGGKRYQAILVDRFLPDCKGEDLLTRIRSEALVNHNVPILQVTADVSEERREAALKIGFDGFIAKPIRPRELVAALADVVMQQEAIQVAHRVKAL